MVVGAIASPELHVIGCVSVCVSPVMDGTPLTLHSWDRLQSYVYIYWSTTLREHDTARCWCWVTNSDFLPRQRSFRVNIKWHFNPCFALSHAYLVGPISAFNWQVYVLALVRLWWLMKQLSVHPICGWNQHPAAQCLASAGCYHCCQLKLSHQHEMVLMDPGPVTSVQLQYNWIQSKGFHTSVSLQASY